MLSKSRNLFFYTAFHSKIRFITGRNLSTEYKEQQITIDKQTINYLKAGTGKRTLFLFPGQMGSIWTDFKPQIESLNKETFTLVAWDPPGYGKSRPPNRKFTNDFYWKDANLAHKLLQVLNIDRYSILGWSDGGISSMILASTRPENVEKLVVWGSKSYVTHNELETYEKFRNSGMWSDRIRSAFVAIYGAQLFEEMKNDWADAVTEMYKKGGNFCNEVLPNIKCPTFILYGAKDVMAAPEHKDHLKRHIKNSRLYVFPEGKHNIHLKYANEFNRMVTKFLLEEQ